MQALKQWCIQLNLFPQNVSENPDGHTLRNRIGLIMTRVYLIILVLILLIIGLTFGLPSIEEYIHIEYPSFDEYELLPSDTVCSCKQQSISFNGFLLNNPSFHQVCHSDFISAEWISAFYFAENQSSYENDDFRKIGFSFFQTIEMLCRISRTHTQNILATFYSKSLSSINLLSQQTFEAQIMAEINRFRGEAPKSFQTRTDVINRLISGSFLFNSLYTSIRPTTTWISRYPVKVETQSVRLVQENGSACYCGASLFCEAPVVRVSKSNDSQFNSSFDIPGLRQRCMPVDTTLHSTLECFFNQSCVDTIISYLSMEIAATTMVPSVSSRFEITDKIKKLAEQLMIEDWGFKGEFKKYFLQCIPKSCSYVTVTRRSLLQTIGFLITMLGSLCRGLRIVIMIAIYFIQRMYRSRALRTATASSSSDRLPQERSRFQKGIVLLQKMVASLRYAIIRLNFFKTTDPREGNTYIYHQIIITRIYIVLLVLILSILTFYTSIRKQSVTKTITQISESSYFSLNSQYSLSLHCPCSEMSTRYETFLSLQPIYHPICSSDLVSAQWIELLRENYRPPRNDLNDLLSLGSGTFQLLALFCDTTKAIIDGSIETFSRRQLVTAEVLSNDLFDSHLKFAIDQWKSAVSYDLLQTIDLFRANMQGNQLLSEGYNFEWNINYFGEISFFFNFFFIDSISLDTCSCALSPQCNQTLSLFDEYLNQTLIDGLILACTPITSLTQSDFRSFYNQSLLDSIISNLPINPYNISFTQLVENVYSRRNETVQLMIDQSFINQWLIDISFTSYYQACAPSLCTYQVIQRPNVLFVVVTIISVFGGLSTSLRILMELILFLLKKVRSQCSRSVIQVWFKQFNNRQHLASRLKVVLIILSLTGLYFSYSLRKYHKIDEVAKEPSYEQYINLVHQYPNSSLECPCSLGSITYGSFINMSVKSYHQICSKSFLQYEWLSLYFRKVHVAVYEQNAFVDLIPAYFQMIAEFCETAQKTIRYQLSTFFSHILIEIMPNPSPTIFVSLMQEKIDRLKIDLAQSVTGALELLREIIHIDQLVTIFRSNWDFLRATLDENIIDSNGSRIQMIPVRYQTCDCGLSKSCTTQMTNHDGIHINGLMIGCYPLEALLQSTFECFFDQSCFEYILDISYLPFDLPPLLLNASLPSRYAPNIKIQDIFAELFVETWSSSISYESYYQACAPSSCFVSSMRSASEIEIITDLLGFYGGLTIIIEHIIVPLIIWSIFRCFTYFYRIHPVTTSNSL